MAKTKATDLPRGYGRFFACWQKSGGGVVMNADENPNMSPDKTPKTEALKAARKAKGLTLEQVAETLDIATSQVSRFEAGARELKVKELSALSELYEVPAAEIANINGTTEVPVMGYIGAGATIETEYEQASDHDGIGTVVLPMTVPEDIIAFVVRGDSMIPVYREGDAILVWREQRYATEHYVGSEVAVHTHEGKRYIKELQYGQRRGTYNLYSYNSRLIEGVGINWVGQIFSIVKADQIRRIEIANRKKAVRRANERARETEGMDELPLDKRR